MPAASHGGAGNGAIILCRKQTSWSPRRWSKWSAFTVEPGTHYLDQLVVAPEFWGIGVATKLINEAKRISPRGLNLDVNTDNARAIAFYEKEDFVIVGEGFNAFSGRPVHHMSWRP